MVRKFHWLIYLLLLSFLLSVNCATNYPDTEDSLSIYLPDNGEIGNWRKNREFQEFKDENLYVYMNGGATIYHEYGFKQMIAQEYTNDKGKSISLEIFKMTNSESAYGIYTFKTDFSGEELKIGQQGRLENYYMNFWKGSFLVTLTGFDESEETEEGLLSIARAVARKIKVKGKVPALVHMLPRENLKSQSIKYFKGNLGLYNINPFLSSHVFGFKEGIKADYKENYIIFIYNYQSSDDSFAKFNEIKKNLQESPGYKNLNEIYENLFQIMDSKERSIFVCSLGKYIVAVLGISSAKRIKIILEHLSENK